MPIHNNNEVQTALFQLPAQFPAELQEEFIELASAPIPKAAFQVSQLIYYHRSDLTEPVIQTGRDLLQYLVMDYQWAGFGELGQSQMDYMDKELGVEAFSDLVDAPDISPNSGVKVPEEPAPEEPAPEEVV